MKTDQFLQYILAKYFVFHSTQVKFQESDLVCDINILKSVINTDIKRITDASMTKLTKDILSNFLCFDITFDLLSSESILLKHTRLDESKAADIYSNFKKYRCSSSKIRTLDDNSDCC